MSNKSVNIREIMAEIKKKANNTDYNAGIADINGMPEKLTEEMKKAISKEEISADLEIINKDYYADYDVAMDAGSPLRAKIGNMIKVRVSPVFAKRNKWSASVVRLINALSKQASETRDIIEDSDPALMKVQINELELKLHMAVKQIEIMNSRITELEKAAEKAVKTDE